jgi:HD-GYP domain-containing protein (c-di-GMP phosphodiesterase class II)
MPGNETSETTEPTAGGKRPPILTIGLEPESAFSIRDLLAAASVEPIAMNLDLILADRDPAPALILTGTPTKIAANELAQVLRMKYPSTPLFMCTKSREGFERKIFMQNGFTDAFLLPIDGENLKIAIQEALSAFTSGEIKSYRTVKLIDLLPDTVLEFDTSVYLPANNRYLKISEAGDRLDEERVNKIKSGKVGSIYVPSYQMPKFYAYTAKRLKDLGSGTFSVTERRERLSAAVRELISGIFAESANSFEAGQAILNDCAHIVKAYILDGAESEWYSRIIEVLGEKGNQYSHSANISTLAALFSMGLGIGKPEELALAALLHDVGIAELPPEIQELEPEEMTEAQLTEYKKHPELSLNLIRSRKIVVSDTVAKAITQHHELFNGAGYPKGFYGDRISKEAQILALADQFDYLTRLREGKPLLTPVQAVEKIRTEQVNDPSRIHYNPDLVKKILQLFPIPN